MSLSFITHVHETRGRDKRGGGDVRVFEIQRGVAAII